MFRKLQTTATTIFKNALCYTLGTKFISEYDKLCCLRKFLWLVDSMAMSAEVSETSKPDFVFSYSCFSYYSGFTPSVAMAVCFWSFVSP